MFALYLIFYSIARFIAEFWRIDTWVIGDIRIAHFIAVLTFLLGIGLFVLQNRRAWHNLALVVIWLLIESDLANRKEIRYGL